VQRYGYGIPKYRRCVQNTEMLIIIIMYVLCSKGEMFIHVAIQNFTMWLLYTELGITAGQQTILTNCVVCLTTLVRYPVGFDLKFTSVLTSVVAYCEHCIVVQQKLDIPVAFLGMVSWLPFTSDLLRWPSYAMSFSSLIITRTLV